MLLKEAGTFRGAIIDHAVNVTKNGFPQWTPQIRALEKYDFDEAKWVDYSYAGDDNEITGFLCLFAGDDKKATFHVADTMEAVEWDGKSLAQLNGMDLENAGIQFTVKEDEYDGKVSLKIANVSPYDSTPSRGSVRKMDDNDVKKLDALFANQLKKAGGAAKPVSKKTPAKKTAAKKTPAKTTPPKAPDVPGQTLLTDEFPVEQDDTPETPAAPATPAAPTPPPAPSTPAPPAPPAPPVAETVTYDKAAAWNVCIERKGPQETDEEVAKVWSKEVHNQLSEGQGEDDLTPEQWGIVATNVIAQTGVPF